MIVEEGQLKGSFRGFDNPNTIFQFHNGGVWRQAAYKYHYHYDYMPRARVVYNGKHYVFEVEGMGDRVEVCQD